MEPMGTRHVRGLVAGNRRGVSRVGGPARRCGLPTTWIASINTAALGEYLERALAKCQSAFKFGSDAISMILAASQVAPISLA
jgi:hypothetical protein